MGKWDKIIVIFFFAAALFLVWMRHTAMVPTVRAQNAPAVELACPAGFGVMPFGTTVDNSNGKLRQWLCSNYSGQVAMTNNYPALTAGTLPPAASGGPPVVISDSTVVAAEGQACVGGGSTLALAFSNGVIWKCF